MDKPYVHGFKKQGLCMRNLNNIMMSHLFLDAINIPDLCLKGLGYIYVHATPSITEASLSLHAAVKTIFHTNLGNPACNASLVTFRKICWIQTQRSLTVTICCFIPLLRFPATMHSASSPWMPGQAEINAVEITPFMATACQIHKHAKHIKKHPLFSKDMETTWKKTQLCYFSDYLHFTL